MVKKKNVSITYFLKTKKKMDPLEFESRISAMSRRRHSQLDHESRHMHLVCLTRLSPDTYKFF